MKKRYRPGALSLTLALLVGPPAQAATIATWVGGSSGNWHVEENWSGGEIPDGPDDQATITSGATVVVPLNASVERLTIGPDNEVQVANSRVLFLQEESVDAMTVANDGTIRLASTGSTTHLQASGAVATLTGNGQVTLEGANATLSAVNGSFVNDTLHTIRGNGRITAPVENRGLIRAEGGAMTVNGVVTNTSTMTTAGAGNTLKLEGATVTGGTLDAAGGSIQLANATVAVPDRLAGNLAVTSNSTLQGPALLDTGSQMTVQNSRALYLKDHAGAAPVVTNRATIAVDSTGSTTHVQASGAVATLTGNGEVALNGASATLSAVNGSFVNDTLHTIRGNGQITAPVENRGVIRAEDGTMTVSGAVTNLGTMTTAGAGSTLKLQGATVTGGTLDAAGGGIQMANATVAVPDRLAGSLAVTSNSTLQGPALLDTGSQLTVENSRALYLKDHAGAAPVVTNRATIAVDSTGSTTHLQANGAVATLTGNGEVALNGTNATLSAVNGSFVNDTLHTIRGNGQITAPVENRGVIRAEGGTMTVTGAVTNPGTMTTAGSGNTLKLQGTTVTGGTLDAAGGGIQMNGATLASPDRLAGNLAVTSNSTLQGPALLDTGSQLTVQNSRTLYLKDHAGAAPVVTNRATIAVDSTGSTTHLQANGAVATFTGNGEVALNGANTTLSAVNGSFVNDTLHTIRGNGQITAAVENRGTIRAQGGGTLQVHGSITGTGQLAAADGSTLRLNTSAQAGTLSLAASGSLFVANNQTLDLSNDFRFLSTDEGSWNWGLSSTLLLSGEGVGRQSLEIGGADLGLSAAGFASNFDLPHLTLSGAGTYAYLADRVDNGNRSSPEAVYVDQLLVMAGTTLNLNGLSMYTYLGGQLHEVMAGEGSLFGGGAIINRPVPIPGAIWLLASGLAALAGVRRRGYPANTTISEENEG
ncbi:MAG: hypothetical protein AB1634_09180 [Thermodesulfobacteriota bacterium]